MFSIFKSDPVKKLNKQLSAKLEQAMHAQRNGDIRLYSQLSFEADEIDSIVDDINAKGYGLTFGLHTRIDDRVESITTRLKVGNMYINRNQIGAVVGSQPFGGEGLSGTGSRQSQVSNQATQGLGSRARGDLSYKTNSTLNKMIQTFVFYNKPSTLNAR